MAREIEFEYWKHSSNEEWKKIIEPKLKTSKAFEIHCWEDERNEIEMALRYGKIKKTDWAHGTVIEGEVTPEFIHFILSLPKPTDTEVYNKMTPFFDIVLDNGFWSEHYGTELIEE